MDLGYNPMPTFCSRLIYLLEDFLTSTNETRCFLTETCQDLVQINKCFSTTKSDYTYEVHERTLGNVDKSNVKQQIHREKSKKSSGNSKYQINNQHTDPRKKIDKLTKKISGCVRTNYSSNLSKNQKILSGVKCIPTCQEKIMPDNVHIVNGTEYGRSCITDAKTNLKCIDTSKSKNNVIHGSDRRISCNCRFFSSFEDIMKHSEPSLHMLDLFKNHNSYLINSLATAVHSSFMKNSTLVKSDSNIVESGSPEKRFLNILSFINSYGLNEAADPVVKLLCDTQSIYLAIMEIINSKELKLDCLLWERIVCLERRFLHLLNICESASFNNVKDDKNQRDVSYKNKIISNSLEIWNQSCANEVQALIGKPYVQYKNRSEWENYQKTLQIIQQKKMQLQILEMLISDFLPQLHNLDPNSPITHLLLTIAFTLTSNSKHSIPLLVKV